ncbi:hypothetical protein GF357_01590 [Candidatus Dojkabacteria bacterium]|nr:hypothetical protein [Candidatus Dojkabacteria bacterium]
MKSSAGTDDIEVPRDRNGTFKSVLLGEYGIVSNEIEDKVLIMYARGMTTGDISASLAYIYGIETSDTETKARETLIKLRGNWDVGVTGYTLIDVETHKSVTRVIETKIKLRNFTDDEMEAYIKSGEPLDKAGAYSEAKGSILIEEMRGDIFNVQGLPLAHIGNDLLHEFSYRYWEHWEVDL